MESMLAIGAVLCFFLCASGAPPERPSIAAAPESSPAASPSLAPDIYPDFPNSLTMGPSPFDDGLPTIPSSPSPPNPDALPAGGPDFNGSLPSDFVASSSTIDFSFRIKRLCFCLWIVLQLSV